MWLNKTQRHFRLTPRCSNMDEWKWWRLRWPSMEFNIAQLLQNVIWYVIIWTGCNTFQGYSVSVCEFNENPVTRPETRRESGERRLSSEPSLFFVRSTVKQSVRNSCSVEKKKKKEKRALYLHYMPNCDTSGSNTLVLSAFFIAAGFALTRV